jgi:hypothetical protein
MLALLSPSVFSILFLGLRLSAVLSLHESVDSGDDFAEEFGSHPYLPHHIKDYRSCLGSQNSTVFAVEGIYVINAMQLFEGILIGQSTGEIYCGEVQMKTQCDPLLPLPSQPSTLSSLCDSTNCPILPMEPTMISFHSADPLPANESCLVHIEIFAGQWTADGMMCQNQTMVTCIEFNSKPSEEA